MPSFDIVPIFEPQFVPNPAGKLAFAAGGNIVPANTIYQIRSARVVVRNQFSPSFQVVVEVWRVPAGFTNTADRIVMPLVFLPNPSSAFPWLELTVLWGAVLKPGDSIWALAGLANEVTIFADGIVVNLP